MPKKSMLLITLCHLVLSTPYALAGETGHLIAEIKGVQNKPHSTVICAIHESEESFPMKPERALKTMYGTLTGDTAICEFEVHTGKFYAISVAHDENGNRKLDTNIFGLPKEGWGTSQNVTHHTRAPNFEESKVKLDTPEKRIQLEMHY